MRRVKRARLTADAELDITSFLNLMIVLVPVLLMSMVFSQITVLKIELPGLAAASSLPADQKNQPLEVVVRGHFIDVNFPKGVRLQRIPVDDVGSYKLDYLSQVLQEVKSQLKQQDIEKDTITLLFEPEIDYQTIVAVMDAVRSYEAVVVTSVVAAALFPEISLGDAPQELEP